MRASVSMLRSQSRRRAPILPGILRSPSRLHPRHNVGSWHDEGCSQNSDRTRAMEVGRESIPLRNKTKDSEQANIQVPIPSTTFSRSRRHQSDNPNPYHIHRFPRPHREVKPKMDKSSCRLRKPPWRRHPIRLWA